MKKYLKFAFIASLFLIILPLEGCFLVGRNDKLPTDLMAEILELFPDAPDCRVYFDGAAKGEKEYLSPEKMGLLYTGKRAAAKELSLLEGFAVRIPKKIGAFELHIAKVADKSSVPTIEALFEKRISMLKNAGADIVPPSDYESTAANAEIYTVGNYVFLLSTNNNAAVKEIIDKAVR